ELGIASVGVFRRLTGKIVDAEIPIVVRQAGIAAKFGKICRFLSVLDEHVRACAIGLVVWTGRQQTESKLAYLAPNVFRVVIFPDFHEKLVAEWLDRADIGGAIVSVLNPGGARDGTGIFAYASLLIFLYAVCPVQYGIGRLLRGTIAQVVEVGFLAGFRSRGRRDQGKSRGEKQDCAWSCASH